ncbi:MAG: VWA domain-containing protein [Deltaproteobacteria bacterium]|nr:VWA domain-containing protein [Deltaproteobacteria bacterium]
MLAPRRQRIVFFALVLALSTPGVVSGWGTLTGGLNLSATETDNLKFLIREYGLDPKGLGAQFDARTGAHPIHQFLVHQALTILGQDPAVADGKSGLPEVTAINAWDGIERCEQGMRERTPSTVMPITELAPPRAEGDTTSRPGADAELDASGGWNPTYNGRAHYWNPWLEDGEAPRLVGENYERLAILTAMNGDPAKRAHFAAYLAHYVSDPVSAKHADVVSLEPATLEGLVAIAHAWMEEEDDDIEAWIASRYVTQAVELIENQARINNPATADQWLARVRAHVGLIGGTKLVKRGWWYVSWLDIADSSLRSAVACYLHELASRPKSGAGVVKPIDRFYSYFDPFYFNGPIFNPALKAPDFSICVPLSEHLFWETNPDQYQLVRDTLSAPGDDIKTILGKPDPKATYLPWQKKPGFDSFDDKKAGEAMRETAADLVKRCSLLAHRGVGDDVDFVPPFKDHMTLAVKCVATVFRATVTALRGEGWARRTPDGQMRSQLVIENKADVPATLVGVRFYYLDAAGKPQSAPGWTVELSKSVPPGEPLDVGATIEGVPADVPVDKMVALVHADFGTWPDSGRLMIPLGKREARRVMNPSAGTTLVRTKGPVDVIVVMDTTGSMQGAIDSMRDNAIASIRRLNEKTDDIRMAVVTFRDRAEKADAGHFLLSGFTRDLESQFAFMRELKADGGGDTPEDQLDGLSRAIALWESEPQDEDRVPAKIIVTITDAPAKEPDAAGNTFDTIAERAYNVDPAHIYTIVVGTDSGAHEHAKVLADKTQGQVLSVKTGTEVADALLAAVDTAVVVHGGETRSGGSRLGLWIAAGLLALASAGAVVMLVRSRRRARLHQAEAV